MQRKALYDSEGILKAHGFEEFQAGEGETVRAVPDEYNKQPGAWRWDATLLRDVAVLLLLFLTIFVTPAFAQYQVTNCDNVPGGDRRTNMTTCNQSTTGGGRSVGVFYLWNGSAWVLMGGSGSGTVTSVGVTVPAFLNVSGSPVTGAGTLALSLSGTALPIAAGGTGGTTAAGARTALGLAIGTDVQAFDADLTGLSGLSSTGFVARTGSGTYAERTLTAVANEITISSNAAGVAGNPLIGLASTVDLTNKTAFLPPNAATLSEPCTNHSIAVDRDATSGSRLHVCESSLWVPISGGGTGTSITFQEEGSSLAVRSTVNVIGAALTAADDGSSKTTITLSQSPAGSGSVVGTGRTVSTTSPLAGGGNLTGDLTITCTTCATASGAASGQIGVFTSALNLDSHAGLGYDGTDLTLGNVSSNYVRIVTAALTAPRVLTAPDADSVSVIPTTATSNQFLTHITSGGVQTKAQPSFSNISGVNTVPKGGTSISTIGANKLLGSVSADTLQEIAIGSGLSLAAGTLSASGGGSGTPGGSTTQVQYNNAGAFGGDEDMTFDNVDKKLSIGVDPGIDPDNTPLFQMTHDGTNGILTTAGTGTGAGNVGIKLTTEGTGRVTVSSLTSTGAATGKTVVCADTNGVLYRSSTGTDCSN